MLGSAALSILKFLRDLQNIISKNIMIWDIAAGIAILSGSGGKYALSNGSYPNSFNLVATNGIIK